jgi:hypothetical protein
VSSPSRSALARVPVLVYGEVADSADRGALLAVARRTVLDAHWVPATVAGCPVREASVMQFLYGRGP